MTRLILISSILALTLVVSGCKPEAKAPEPVRPVLSTVVEPMRSSSTVAVGTVEPRFKTDLSFRLLGRLIARPVNVGDLVGQGDVIAAIDSTALEFAVRSAKAELAKSQAQLANTSATEERQRTLITTDATTKATLDNAVQARAGAEASVARAQANLTKALEQLRLCAAEIRLRRCRYGRGRGRRTSRVAWPERRHSRASRHQRGCC